MKLITKQRMLAFLGAFVIGAGVTRSDSQSKSALKSETFDRDPGWEGHNNRIVPKNVPTVTQDFGYSANTHFAGKEAGEMGGQVWRSTTPAFYAAKIPARTLNDKLSASGTFAITAPAGSAGVFFGWFDSTKPPSGGRPLGSLGLNINCEKAGGQLAVRLIAGSNKACGTFITPFTPGPTHGWYTPLKKDVRFSWTLSYDPAANNGNGRFQFTIRSHRDKHEEWEGKTFSVDVPPEVRKDGATFDHFGLVNLGKGGNSMSIYFDDLEYDGKKEDFSRDPGWDASGNRVKFQEPEPAGAHNYGFSADTNHAGGKAGEIGGAFWRTEKNFGYYADRVGPLTLADRLEASGKVMLAIGGPDSDMRFGWFSSEGKKEDKPFDGSNFVGIAIGGPTRVGHYFQPTCATAKGTRRRAGKGPLLVPGKLYEWSFLYDPAGNNGQGSMQVTLGGESVTLDLKRGDKQEGARLDRFGLVSTRPGGGIVKIWFDDLQYTAGPSSR